MIRKRLFAIPFICMVMFCGSSHTLADEISFRCTVKNEYRLADDGQLVKPEKYFYTGASFIVERSTGRIIGGAFHNMGIAGFKSDWKMKVIDSGSAGSFKVFSFAEQRGVAESLAVITRQEGEKKAFVGIDYLQTVVTGICD